MGRALVVGLNELSGKIIDHLRRAKYGVFGFDFDVDIVSFFGRQNLIDNSPRTPLNDLMRETDIVIMNIDFSKYENILKFLPFTKSDCLLINTNTFKENIGDIRNMLQNRRDNFIPCNFLLFPENVILSYDATTKMNTILGVSSFFRDIKIKTSVLNPAENDRMFANVFQLPFLLEKILFKNGKLHLTNDLDYTKYDFFNSDILLNRKNVLAAIETLVDSAPNPKNIQELYDLVENNNLPYLKEMDDPETSVGNEATAKIIVEKLFIRTFLNRLTENYFDRDLLNFDYPKYDIGYIRKYIKENRANLEVSLVIMREKMINLSLFLQFEDVPLGKFVRYMMSN